MVVVGVQAVVVVAEWRGGEGEVALTTVVVVSWHCW
jgi:hypothetical protein